MSIDVHHIVTGGMACCKGATARLEVALVGGMQGNGETVSDPVELLLRDE
jgi:hypothetical protein